VAEVRADENSRLERGLVPRPIVRDPALWIASSYLPGRRRALLGGDFYDAVETVDGCLHVIVGDVAGRGPDEAALGAGLRIAWRALTLSGAPGHLVLETLEQMIEHERQISKTFATLCTVEIKPSRHELCLRRAGHPPPILIDGASITSLPLDRGGPPIGMFAESKWSDFRFELPTNWSILLYTDGIIEGSDGGSGRLGEDGLRRLIADYVEREPGWHQRPHDLLAQLVTCASELDREGLSDDVAMLLVGSREDRAPGG
jgi:serine phosphatase RsbU (regulator of sigma subunit)